MAATDAQGRVDWRIAGNMIGSCNCDWGCPCQFYALPTHRSCEGYDVTEIVRGHFGETALDGFRYAQIYHFDGAMHEGNGWRQLILDERSTPAQRAAIEALVSGTQGHPFFEINAAVTSHNLDPIVAAIELTFDYERRTARSQIAGLAEARIEPIRDTSGNEHHARIDLPHGFEFRVAEMADSVRWHTSAGGPLTMAYEHTYAQLSRFEWASDGSVR